MKKASEAKKLLDKLIKLYKSNSTIVDYIHVEQLLLDRYNERLLSIEDRNNKVIKIK
jgi:hypothetical protein